MHWHTSLSSHRGGYWQGHYFWLISKYVAVATADVKMELLNGEQATNKS